MVKREAKVQKMRSRQKEKVVVVYKNVALEILPFTMRFSAMWKESTHTQITNRRLEPNHLSLIRCVPFVIVTVRRDKYVYAYTIDAIYNLIAEQNGLNRKSSESNVIM